MLVVNMDVVDRHEESALAAPRVLQLCQMVSEANAGVFLAFCTCNSFQWLKWQSVVWRLWALSQKGNELSRGLSDMHDRLSTICTDCVIVEACPTSAPGRASRISVVMRTMHTTYPANTTEVPVPALVSDEHRVYCCSWKRQTTGRTRSTTSWNSLRRRQG